MISILVSVQRISQIRRRIKGIVDIQFVFKMTRTIIFDDRKVQMHTYWIGRVARIISLVPKQRADLDWLFRSTRGEF